MYPPRPGTRAASQYIREFRPILPSLRGHVPNAIEAFGNVITNREMAFAEARRNLNDAAMRSYKIASSITPGAGFYWKIDSILNLKSILQALQSSDDQLRIKVNFSEVKLDLVCNNFFKAHFFLCEFEPSAGFNAQEGSTDPLIWDDQLDAGFAPHNTEFKVRGLGSVIGKPKPMDSGNGDYGAYFSLNLSTIMEDLSNKLEKSMFDADTVPELRVLMGIQVVAANTGVYYNGFHSLFSYSFKR